MFQKGVFVKSGMYTAVLDQTFKVQNRTDETTPPEGSGLSDAPVQDPAQSKHGGAAQPPKEQLKLS